MPTQVQGQRHGIAARPGKQASTKSAPAPAASQSAATPLSAQTDSAALPPVGGPGPAVRVRLHVTTASGEVLSAELPNTIAAETEAVGKYCGSHSFGEFMRAALQEKLERSRSYFSPEGEMDRALNQNAALSALLQCCISGPVEGQFNEAIQCGLVELEAATQARLSAAAAALQASGWQQRTEQRQAA